MKPILTVATVTFNAEKILVKTMESVASQTLRHRMEYIIIDGASTDLTLKIISEREPEIDQWISEPDKGIYDAMNKAAKMAKGDWVLFLNAGDVFESPSVVEVMDLDSVHADVIYGDCYMTYPDGRSVYDRCLPVEKITRRMICSHQSLFIRRAALLEFPFDTSYRICADFNQLGRMYKNGRKIIRKPVAISRVELESYTWKQIKEGHRQKSDSSAKVFGRFSDKVYFYFRGLDLGLRHFIKKILKLGSAKS